VLSRFRRLALGGLLVTLAVVAVISGTVAGAATAPQPDPAQAIPVSAMPEDPPVVPPPRRHVARGAVVMVREDRMALMVEAGERPIVVAVRPKTAIRLNQQKAEFGDLQRGDHAIVVGKAGPSGNMIAKAIVAVRKPAPQPSS